MVHGGTVVRAVVAYYNVLDTDLYLRIAAQLYLRRRVIGGMARLVHTRRRTVARAVFGPTTVRLATRGGDQVGPQYYDAMALDEDKLTPRWSIKYARVVAWNGIDRLLMVRTGSGIRCVPSVERFG